MLSVLSAIVRPGGATVAAVTADTLTLAQGFGSAEVALGDIEACEVRYGRYRSQVRLRYASRQATVSGLSRKEAGALADLIETARADWWRRALAARAGALRSVHDRLAQFADPPGHTTRGAVRDLRRDAEEAADRLPSAWPDTLSDVPEIGMLEAIREFLQDPESARAAANRIFVENELNRSRELFDRAESGPLTDEQRRAVVLDDARNLVVAAAGSGKTSVIVAKAEWLIRRGHVDPSRLLLLTFARDARDEIAERLGRRLGSETARGLAVRTFHSLGMAITGEAEGRRPELARTAEDDWALSDQLDRILGEQFADRAVSGRLVDWFRDRFAPYRSAHEFRSRGEYWDYMRRHEIRSLNGEKVRSFEECRIADFLCLNGVRYEYERPYEHDTATARRRQYRPDFWLPDAGVYIEHFALSAAGEPPPFIDRDEYLQGIEWKRRLHAEHGTVLVETFSHEHAAGQLIERLIRKLRAHGVTLSPVDPEEVLAVLKRLDRIGQFTRLLATFLRHYKGSRMSFGELARRAADAPDRRRSEAFVAVFRPIFERYQDMLSRAGEIDFHDMIDRAAEHVEEGRYRSPFDYILVDEFQDISPGRARLLKALLEQSRSARLFAVGDDWQSIYRFAGSDIAVMREFERHFGDSERIALETTFRCSDRIAGVANRFVLRNPAQLRKEVRSTRRADRAGVHVAIPVDNRSLLTDALDRIAAEAAGHDGTPTVLLLGRYRRLRPENMSGLARTYPGLEISFRTIHGSKGLEADYVVALGMTSGKYGFPTEIVDDPLLDLVLAAPETCPNAEERRLFYVAITRARHGVFLLAEGGPPSGFVHELIDEKYDVAFLGGSPENDVPCPNCVTGRLERRRNARSGKIFHGCSNWPYCEYASSPCPACGEGLPIRLEGVYRCGDCGRSVEGCPACDGWLQLRIGRYGRFLGCSNFPRCDYTRNLPQPRPPGSAVAGDSGSGASR